MARRKKYPKLANGMGSISYLGKGRRNPFCVRLPSTTTDADGNPIRGKVLCCTDTWMHGFAALLAWHSGSYTQGLEATFDTTYFQNDSDLARRILADYARISKRTDGITFRDVYRAAFDHKFSHSDASKATLESYARGFSRCKPIYDKPLKSLGQANLQAIIDNYDGLSKSSLDEIKKVFSLTYKYAIANGIVTVDCSKGLIAKETEVKHGQAFSDDELRFIWKNAETDIDFMRIAIMCLSGFRVSAYRTLEINLEEGYFKGGVKTKTSKDRIVPIHESIRPMVEYLLDRKGALKILWTNVNLQNAFHRVNPEATPHWTRHTFSALCERFGVRENDRKRMLGHKIGDITNDIYGHRTLEDLRTELAKIDVQKIVQPEILP